MTDGGADERSDADLLAAHVAGDPDAFAVLFTRHRDRLWAVALRTMGNPHDAADGLQDGLIAAYRRADSFRGDAAVTTWLHRIVVNACLDRVRRRQARPTVPLIDTEQVAAVPAIDSDTAVDVRAALARLPVDQRVVLVLVDVQGYAVAEAAAMLGVPEGTVKSRCARGRARLAALLGYLRNPATGAGVPSATDPAGTSAAGAGEQRPAGGGS